jgi:hypothetical protein
MVEGIGMALFKRGEMWWYKFYFAGQLIRESAKSSEDGREER